MNAMTKEERELVDEMRTLADDAERGPWWVVLLPHGVDDVDQDAVIMSEHISITDKHEHGEMRPSDARFAARAREAVPALCDLAERLAAKVEQLEAELAGKQAGTQ